MEAIAATRYCLKIRNQYAHCTWHDDLTGSLGFVELEEISFDNNTLDLTALTIKHLDTGILKQQEEFFLFVARCLTYLNFEVRKRAGKLASRPVSAPQKVGRQSLCTP